MENAATVIVITNSGEEEGNGSKEMKLENGVAVKSKLDEYREIADLTGFENLKAMVLAESLMKRKRTRKEKKKDKTKLQSSYREIADVNGYDNLKAMLEAEASMRIERRNRKTQKRKTQFDAQENDIARVNLPEEQVQLDEDEGLSKIEEKERNRRREKRRKRQRAKVDEYLKKSDLSGFENLKPMIEAEASIGERKKNKKMVDMEFCGQEGVNGPELIQTSQMDEPQHHIIDPVKGDEDAGMIEDVPMLSAVGGDDGIDPVEVIGHCFSSLNSVEVIDRCCSSSEDDKSGPGVNLGRSAEHMVEAVQTTEKTGANGENCVEVINIFLSCSDVSLGRKVEDALPMESTVKGKKRTKRRKKTRPTQEKEMANYAREENDAKYNAVRRMLFRKPRYFDASDWNLETCLIYGKEKHTAACCEVKKKNKPCFLCASYKHSWKNCIQGKDCFIGKGAHHIAYDCSETDEANIRCSVICLKCGDSGHDMFSCGRGNIADEEIRCYICKSFGHLCCVNPSNTDVKQVSCYNCGASGHLGEECTKSCEASSGIKRNVVCYKCGVKGHFARRCSSHFKDRLRISDLLSTALPVLHARIPKGSTSTPHSRGKGQGSEGEGERLQQQGPLPMSHVGGLQNVPNDEPRE